MKKSWEKLGVKEKRGAQAEVKEKDLKKTKNK